MFVAPIAVRDCGDEDPLVEIRSGHDLRQRAEDAEQARGAGHLSRAAGAAPDVVREQASIRRVQLIEQVPVQEVACALTGDHILDKTETAGKVAVGGGGGVGGGPRDGGGRRRAPAAGTGRIPPGPIPPICSPGRRYGPERGAVGGVRPTRRESCAGLVTYGKNSPGSSA